MKFSSRISQLRQMVSREIEKHSLQDDFSDLTFLTKVQSDLSLLQREAKDSFLQETAEEEGVMRLIANHIRLLSPENRDRIRKLLNASGHEYTPEEFSTKIQLGSYKKDELEILLSIFGDLQENKES